ncbi:hypothetical protein ACROYT_G017985 [Oculina patagonica]
MNTNEDNAIYIPNTPLMRHCTECHITPPRLGYVTHDKFIYTLRGSRLFRLQVPSQLQYIPNFLRKRSRLKNLCLGRRKPYVFSECIKVACFYSTVFFKSVARKQPSDLNQCKKNNPFALKRNKFSLPLTYLLGEGLSTAKRKSLYTNEVKMHPQRSAKNVFKMSSNFQAK